MRHLVTIATVVVLVLAAGTAVAEPPSQLSYQGYFTDSVGNPVTGSWTVTFSFFTSPNGGESFYDDTVDLDAQLGLFSVLLGGEPGNPLPVELFSEGEVWLELAIETDDGPVVLDPRQQVVSNPYSLYSVEAGQCEEAANAVTLGGQDAELFVTTEQIPELCIPPDELEGLLLALGYEPGPGFTLEELALYLADNGYFPCACYGDDNVAAYLEELGYEPGPAFSGLYEDLIGAPDLSNLLTDDDLLTVLAVSGAVLMSDGSVALQGDLDFAGLQALNLAVHNADVPPDAPSPGQLWWNTSEEQLQVHTGIEWSSIGGGVAADLSCPECVDAEDVSFTFAAADQKGGAAVNVSCFDCIDEEEVSFPWAKGTLPGGDAEHALSADWAANVVCAGCVQVAEIDPGALNSMFISYDPQDSGLNAGNLQDAVDELAGGGAGGFQEGNGTVIPYIHEWGLPAYGKATSFIHLMNPIMPKVVMHLYAQEASSFASSANLVVAYEFTPNQYSAGAIGNVGETALQVGNPSIFNNGSHVMVHQTVGGSGTTAGDWEINQVTAINGTTLQLLKPLEHSYVTNATTKAQVVLAASFGQLEIVNGGKLKPAAPLAADGSAGGIIYIRANKVTVKSGGIITADGAGFHAGAGQYFSPGVSECGKGQAGGNAPANCSGGAGAKWMCANAGGGGNKTAGEDGAHDPECTVSAEGGEAKGDAQLNTLEFGGGGGSQYLPGGAGGGIVVIGAQDFIVQDGGTVRADGENATWGGSGGGAGGTIAIYADFQQVDGATSAAGGTGGSGYVWKHIDPVDVGPVNFDTHSHGGGYSPKYKEFWYPQWSGTTIYQYDENYQSIGSFGSGSSDIMQVWGDIDGTYYTANWGQDRVRKFAAKSSSQIWEHHIGSTAGGVCSDGEYVFAVRHSGDTVWKLNKDNGNQIETFSLPNMSNSIHGALICTPGRLYYGGGGGDVRMYDLETKQQVDSFYAGTSISNLAFDGQIMYISPNSSTVTRWKLLEGNVYEGEGQGGDGGEGWFLQLDPLQGIINESYPKGVEIWVDGEELTPVVGDPNSIGAPSWDEGDGKWGGDGLTAWSTGPLDLTAAADWTLGEHKIELKETGGAGGELKMYTYVIYPFTKSLPPTNDTCNAPIMLDLFGPVTQSGTTEDVMGKNKATDANLAPFCGGSGGPDVVYGFVLEDWRQLTVEVVSAFTARTYIKKGDCFGGTVVGCGEDSWVSDTLEPGTYYLFVDGDGNLQKGDFTLQVTPAAPGPPTNDTCAGAYPLTFEGGTAQAAGMTLFANDDYQAVCGGEEAAENVYEFNVSPGVNGVTINVDADFNPVIYVSKDICGAPPIVCVPESSYTMAWPTPGTYYLYVDGKTAADKGLYTATVTLN